MPAKFDFIHYFNPPSLVNSRWKKLSVLGQKMLLHLASKVKFIEATNCFKSLVRN